MRQGRQELEILRTEIASLKGRRNNIDDRQIRIRADLCAALGVAADEMPFAGELIQVRDEEGDYPSGDPIGWAVVYRVIRTS